MSASAKILVVDDEPKNVKLLADVLAVRGYRRPGDDNRRFWG